MHRKIFLTSLVTFAGLTAAKPLCASTHVSSTFNDEREDYTTEGYATVDAPLSITGQIAENFDEYRNWSLEGINGDPENSRKFISLIKDIVYSKDYESGVFTVKYDVDLIFPFNRTDESLKFTISDIKRTAQGNLYSFQIDLNDDSMVINKFHILITLRETPAGQSVISFSSTFQLASIFAIFFSLKRYRQNVEWRILRIIENMNHFAEKLARN